MNTSRNALTCSSALAPGSPSKTTTRGPGPAAACLFVLLALLWIPAGHASIASAPGKKLQVALITYGPGTTYWERFGHDAIEIRDTESGQAVNFNYGVFDFRQEHFLFNFARGDMRYSMDAEPAAPEFSWYRHQGRSIRRQQLDLSPRQAAQLRNLLLTNLQPRNRHYQYDYFTRNCATRLRDALDAVLDGRLLDKLHDHASDTTYRAQTDRLMAGQPALMLLLDLGLSGYADQPLSQWQASFIPGNLADALARMDLADGSPLVTSDRQLAASKLPSPPDTPPAIAVPLLLAGLIWALVLATSGHWRATRAGARWVFAVAGTLWLVFAGLAGLGMAILWGFTAHQAAWANENLLLFSPLALLLIPAVWRRRRSRLACWLTGLLTAAAAFALLTKVLPGFDQHNLPWIGLALPPWLALAVWLPRVNGRPRA